MKKILFILLSVILFSVSASAQSLDPLTYTGWKFIKGFQGGTAENPLRLGEVDKSTGLIFEQLVSKDENGTTSFPFTGSKTVTIYFLENGNIVSETVLLENLPRDIDTWEQIASTYPIRVSLTREVKKINGIAKAVYTPKLN